MRNYMLTNRTVRARQAFCWWLNPPEKYEKVIGGWWLSHPSEKYESQLRVETIIPNIWTKKNKFQTTNQLMYLFET